MLNIWRPQIWTPLSERLRRRRRRIFNPLKFAAGDVMVDASGNVILDDDGNVLLDDGAGNVCCCGGGTCADCPPDLFAVAVALYDVQLCPQCHATDDDAGSISIQSGTLSGTYSPLSATLEDCGRLGSFTLTSDDIAGYSGTNCTGNDIGTWIRHHLIWSSADSKWKFWSSVSVGGSADWLPIFQTSWSRGCLPQTRDNELTSCDGTAEFENTGTFKPKAGYDGYVVITD